MKKSMVAILIAFLMTAFVGAAIFVIGGAALLNKSSIPVSNSPAQTSGLNSPIQSNQVSQLHPTDANTSSSIAAARLDTYYQ